MRTYISSVDWRQYNDDEFKNANYSTDNRSRQAFLDSLQYVSHKYKCHRFVFVTVGYYTHCHSDSSYTYCHGERRGQ